MARAYNLVLFNAVVPVYLPVVIGDSEADLIKDRIFETEDGPVLLPEWCDSPSGVLSWENLLRVMKNDKLNLLVTGETGTGKEVIAKCVKKLAVSTIFESINCAGLEPNLVGSELFGHVKGAFSGAVKNRDGLLRECDGGTLFLDEIGKWLPPPQQAQLLRFIESGVIRKIGADKADTKPAKVRIIAATNKDVSDPDILLDDLRHRFNFELHLPPLRDRKGDIFWLLTNPGFLGGKDGVKGINLNTLIGILSYRWEGNVRELRKYCSGRCFIQKASPAGESELSPSSLNDPIYCSKELLGEWSVFAQRILVEAEKAEESILSPQSTPLLYLLKNILRQTNHYLPQRTEESTLYIKPLHQAMHRDSEYDLACLNNLRENAYEDVTWPYTLDVSNFGDAMWYLQKSIECIRLTNEADRESGIDFAYTTAVQRQFPSERFLDRIDAAMPGEVNLFSCPSTDAASPTLETLLREKCINGKDLLICLYCANGMAHTDIAARTDIECSATTVGERLLHIKDKHPDLIPYLKGGNVGRPRKQ